MFFSFIISRIIYKLIDIYVSQQAREHDALSNHIVDEESEIQSCKRDASK